LGGCCGSKIIIIQKVRNMSKNTIIRQFYNYWEFECGVFRTAPFVRVEKVAIEIFLDWLLVNYTVEKRK